MLDRKQLLRLLKDQRSWIAHRTFLHHGLEVLEAIAVWEMDGKPHFKLFWVRMPWTQLQLDGRGNPFVHKDFPVADEDGPFVFYKETRLLEDTARRRVQEEFDAYWGLEPADAPLVVKDPIPCICGHLATNHDTGLEGKRQCHACHCQHYIPNNMPRAVFQKVREEDGHAEGI